MMVCPLCFYAVTYVGLNSLECSNVDCQNARPGSPPRSAYKEGHQWMHVPTGIVHTLTGLAAGCAVLSLGFESPHGTVVSAPIPVDISVWRAL